MKCFERPNGLDTDLYKNLPFIIIIVIIFYSPIAQIIIHVSRYTG